MVYNHRHPEKKKENKSPTKDSSSFFEDVFTKNYLVDNWVVVSTIFYVHPYLGKIPILTSIFFRWVGSTTN